MVRDVAAVVLLMIAAAALADAYQPAYVFAREERGAHFDPIRFAVGVGALAWAWLVYRGPR